MIKKQIYGKMIAFDRKIVLNQKIRVLNKKMIAFNGTRWLLEQYGASQVVNCVVLLMVSVVCLGKKQRNDNK